jgi:GNAT superfamily N-acetyltransferase
MRFIRRVCSPKFTIPDIKPIPMKLLIGKAKPSDNHILTHISFSSKEYWKYPSHYYDIWKNELTITEEYIQQNDVYVVKNSSSIIGFYSLVHLQYNMEVSGITLEKGMWLDHMFLLPDFLHKGIGTKMIFHLKEVIQELNVTELRVLADPNSQGFYEKLGFTFLKDYPSTIEGRTTPLLLLKIH